MKPEKDREPEKKKETVKEKTNKWIGKAADYMDDTAEKIHESEAYKKADQAAEKATKSIFRQAGKLWGKSERYFRKKSEDPSRESEEGSGKQEDQ